MNIYQSFTAGFRTQSQVSSKQTQLSTHDTYLQINNTLTVISSNDSAVLNYLQFNIIQVLQNKSNWIKTTYLQSVSEELDTLNVISNWQIILLSLPLLILLLLLLHVLLLLKMHWSQSDIAKLLQGNLMQSEC